MEGNPCNTRGREGSWHAAAQVRARWPCLAPRRTLAPSRRTHSMIPWPGGRAGHDSPPFFPRPEPAAPVLQPSGLPEKEVGGNECATGEWARTRRELANCHGERACERAHWAAAGSTRGQQQQKSRCPSLGSRQSGLVGSATLPRASVAVRLPACLGPLLFAISRLTQCPTPTRRLLLCFVPFFISFKKIVFSVYPPPKLWHPLLSLASFFTFLSLLFPSISFFFSPSSSFVGFGRRSQESDLHTYIVC